MLNYIRGELYRHSRKKSLYLYFGALAVGYFLLAYMRSGGFKADSVLHHAESLFQYLPPFAGGFLFAAIYTDDLNSKNLISLMGFGLDKAKIVTSKLILMALFGTLAFGLAALFHCGVYALLGYGPTGEAFGQIFVMVLGQLLTTLAFAVLSGAVVYGTQRTTFSFVAYILLSFGMVSSLLAMGLKSFAEGLTKYLMIGIAGRITLPMMEGNAPPAGAVVAYLVYVAVAAVLSAVAFYQKEMEF